MKRYIVRGCYYSNGFYDGQILMTEAGTPLTVKVTPGMLNKNVDWYQKLVKFSVTTSLKKGFSTSGDDYS